MADFGATLKGYLEHWEECFGCEKSSEDLIQRLKILAFQGQLRGCKFRSICWRVFLHCLPPDPNEWKSVVHQSRAQYEIIKSKHICDPKGNDEKRDTSVENPLSQDDQSVWKKFFKNMELKKVIERDVRRTFPEMKFFHDDSVHELLVDVLFCYACEHSDLSYRQGMHELLAPLVFIIHCDLEAASCAKESGQVTELVEVMLDAKYLEHDAYQMFCQLMLSTNQWYSVTVVDDTASAQTEETNSDDSTSDFEKPFQEKQAASTGTLAIAGKLGYIYDTLLVQHDPQLHTHLNHLDIIPQVFGLRWIRLLFGREFTLQDLLVLWDALFADGSTLGLVDYLFVAMLIHIRKQLLESDYTTCLQILMKYPAVDDINDIVQAAKCIREGKKILMPNPNAASSLISPSTSSKPLSPAKTNKQNSFLKAFKEFRRIVSSETRPAQNSPQKRRNFVHTSGSKSFHESPYNMQIPAAEAQIHKLDKMNSMCNYCSDKLDACISTLQAHVCTEAQPSKDNELQAMAKGDDEVNKEEQEKRERILLTLANLKQVRDILRGTINFDLSVVDDTGSSGTT